jgi:hypothetical protein
MFSITDTGRDVLQNESDHLASNDIDLWLGGTHLKTGVPIWRWDETAGKLRLGS